MSIENLNEIFMAYYVHMLNFEWFKYIDDSVLWGWLVMNMVRKIIKNVISNSTCTWSRHHHGVWQLCLVTSCPATRHSSKAPHTFWTIAQNEGQGSAAPSDLFSPAERAPVSIKWAGGPCGQSTSTGMKNSSQCSNEPHLLSLKPITLWPNSTSSHIWTIWWKEKIILFLCVHTSSTELVSVHSSPSVKYFFYPFHTFYFLPHFRFFFHLCVLSNLLSPLLLSCLC